MREYVGKCVRAYFRIDLSTDSAPAICCLLVYRIEQSDPDTRAKCAKAARWLTELPPQEELTLLRALRSS